MTHPAARAAGMLQRPHQMLPVQWAPRPYSSACLEEGLHVARWWSQAPQSLPAIPAPVPASHSTFAARRAACHGAPSWTERRSVPFRAQDTHPSHPRLVVCRRLQLFKSSQVKSSQGCLFMDLKGLLLLFNTTRARAHTLRTPSTGATITMDGGSADTTRRVPTYTGRQSVKRRRRPSFCARPVHLFPRQ